MESLLNIRRSRETARRPRSHEWCCACAPRTETQSGWSDTLYRLAPRQ